MTRFQCCNRCKGPLRLGGGALCARCQKHAKKEPPRPGSIGAAIAAQRASLLLDRLAQPPSVTALPEPEVVNPAITAGAAATLLARAWGVRVGRV